MQSVGSLEQQRKKHLFMTSDLKAISCSSLYKGEQQNAKENAKQGGNDSKIEADLLI